MSATTSGDARGQAPEGRSPQGPGTPAGPKAPKTRRAKTPQAKAADPFAGLPSYQRPDALGRASGVAQALRRAGQRVHRHDGLWWQEAYPYFYQPVDPLRVLRPGEARPHPLRALLGYSHACPRGEHSKLWTVMFLDEARLEGYDIGGLKPRLRSKVRKSLRENQVLRLDGPALRAHARDLVAIARSTAERTGHGLPPAYYDQHPEEWLASLEREFAIPGRDWWAVRAEGRIIAYLYAYAVEGTMFISAAKSLTEALDRHPNEGLLFAFLRHCRERRDVQRVVFGDAAADAPSLNAFKERLGFRVHEIPVFTHYPPGLRLARPALDRAQAAAPWARSLLMRALRRSLGRGGQR